MSAAAVSIRGLTVALGGHRILDNFELDIRPGERLVLAGPSGSGKSTLLRAIAGLVPIQSGEILVDGQPVQDLKPGARRIGMVFQQPALLPHLSVRDNLCFGLRARGTPRARARARAEEMAALLEIAAHLDKRPRALSGGEQQRVALGRALLREGGLILLDEPLSQLDAPLRARLRAELLRLQQLTGTSWLHVTHDQAEALSLADRLGVLNAGRLLQLDTPQQVYARPADRFVGSFVGSPGIVLLPLERTDDGWTWQGLPVPAPAAGHALDSLQLGLRAEHLQLAGDAASGIKARVRLREHLGERDLLHLETEDGHRLYLGVPAETAPAGEWVRVRADFNRASYFAGDTGRRID